MSTALAPNGKRIVGIVEAVRGIASVFDDSFQHSIDGSLVFEYAGETEIDWDSQTSIAGGSEKGRLFVDEEGTFWWENQLALSPSPRHEVDGATAEELQHSDDSTPCP